MSGEIIRTSKFLSLVLRHQPEVIGLTLDAEGWAETDALLDAARAHGRSISPELLARVVKENDKQRFTLSEDGRRIRANQGHSRPVDLRLNAVTPPERLYHGTVAKFLDAIREQGLRKGTRQHVHLSIDTETARRVGSRRGKPIVLGVRAAAMHQDRFQFYRSDNGVWLTEHVPVDYLEFP